MKIYRLGEEVHLMNDMLDCIAFGEAEDGAS